MFNTSIPLKYIALPLGISFISFQAISYIVDIYRGDAVVNKNPFYVALYMSLFPKVTSGPIIKYKHIDEQIRNRSITIEKFSYGIERFIFGLAKKVIISDILGNMSDDIFSVLNTGIDTPSSWIAIICYTLQIYFDFSGYSDMAIGLANMFGFNFIENFNYPYISKSIREFWRRWHISLSTWFKEYLYIPLGGNRKGSTRTLINLLIVFFATGIWHGASPNFIIWGFWHGLFMVIERLIKDKDWYKKIPNFIKLILTLFIVMLGWVFFRVNSISEAIKFIAIMFGIKQYDYVSFDYRYFLNTKLIVWIIIGAVLSTPLISNIFKKYKNIKGFELVKTILIGILFIISIIFIVNSTYSPFIYFQF
ncbi:MBOAT family O-acyltransferase [Clostridium isatidis]|uniref:MBOAT family O-acyltransferase n=1 Tax=Clostridium isatidis TaxID=182773 RepID=UPI001F3AF31F|nr:MBOAT family O-acyltransferase [Clostridium isatidis]